MGGVEDGRREEKRRVILVGDIGGTHTRLAIIDRVKRRLDFLSEEAFPSREEVLK